MPARFALVSFLLLGILAPAIRAGDKFPEPAEVRKAIAESLPRVEEASLAWIKKRDCMSCHHVTFMLWSHNEAQAHGVAVDAKKLAEWNDWSVQKSLFERSFFKLNNKLVETLPKDLQPKLADLIDVSFTHEKEFVAALGKSVPANELDPHKAVLLKGAVLAKKGTVNDGGGLDTMTQLLLGRGYETKVP